MSIKSLANVVTSSLGRRVLVAQKHSPVILFAAGVVGVVATVVLASRATLKLDEIFVESTDKLAEIEYQKVNSAYTEQDKAHDLLVTHARTVGKVTALYAPALVVGVVSVAALTGSHVILSRRNLALTAAYAAIDRGFREYRQRVVSEYGPDKDRELRYGVEEREIVEETKTGPVVKRVKTLAPNGMSIYARCFDKASSVNWSPAANYNQMFLQSQQNYANDLLRARGHVFLNDVFDMLGLTRTREGAIVGWVKGSNGDDFIDFGVFEGDRQSGMLFVMNQTDGVWLDFNVDGVVYDKI